MKISGLFLMALMLLATSPLIAVESNEETVFFAGDDMTPSINIPAKWLECSDSEGCVVYQDSCRGCRAPIAFNKKYGKSLRSLYNQQSQKEGKAMTGCRASCLPESSHVSCENWRCVYKWNKPTTGKSNLNSSKRKEVFRFLFATNRIFTLSS